MSTQHTMRRSLLLLLLAVVTVLVVSHGAYSSWSTWYPKTCLLEPVKHPQQPGPVDLVFRFAPPDDYEGDGRFRVRAYSIDGGQYLGPDEWEFTAFPDQPYERTLSLIVAPDTVTSLTMSIAGGDGMVNPVAYFIHRNDSVEFWKAYPRPPDVPLNRLPKPDDTLDVRVVMRSQEQLNRVLDVLSELPDSTIGTQVITRATVRQLMRIAEMGIEIQNIQPGERDGEDTTEYRGGLRIREQKRPSSQDRDKKAPGGGSDSTGDSSLQGTLGLGEKDRLTAVSIDAVVPMLPDGSILASDTVEFRFRVSNYFPPCIRGLTNGFRIYSPDGATWNSLEGSWPSPLVLRSV